MTTCRKCEGKQINCCPHHDFEDEIPGKRGICRRCGQPWIRMTITCPAINEVKTKIDNLGKTDN